jgi:hypothetical protein
MGARRILALESDRSERTLSSYDRYDGYVRYDGSLERADAGDLQFDEDGSVSGFVVALSMVKGDRWSKEPTDDSHLS